MVVCTDKGVVEGLDAVTGKTMWRMELPKNRHAYSASPVIVDGRVIVVREAGVASILPWPGAATDAGVTVLGGGSVEEMTVATPVCVDGQMFLRTHDSLWCIGAK